MCACPRLEIDERGPCGAGRPEDFQAFLFTAPKGSAFPGRAARRDARNRGEGKEPCDVFCLDEIQAELEEISERL
jgi:hypothetical protein